MCVFLFGQNKEMVSSILKSNTIHLFIYYLGVCVSFKKWFSGGLISNTIIVLEKTASEMKKKGGGKRDKREDNNQIKHIC